jgi:cystathionine beta-lyase/cystathionine gamma-synthase
MTNDSHDRGFATRSIHAGWQPDTDTGAVKRPLVMANSYAVPAGMDSDDVPYIYARDLNPNAKWLEQRLLAIEAPGDERMDCVVTASGVSAINGTFLALLSSGDHMIASEIAYVSVRTMLIEHFPKRFGIDVTLVDTSDSKRVRAAMTPRTKLVHIETPGNPTTLVSDVAAIAEITHQAGALLSVDSTWAGCTQHSLALGADLAQHSLSKYINGHGDALGGAVIGPKAMIETIRRFVVKDMGACISPFNAWQIMRGATTLPLRMPRHNANAQRVAEFLEDHPAVAWVRYPGLESHPQHAIAVKQMDGFSGMLNFDVTGGAAGQRAVIDRLRLFTHATSLGHDESLIMVYHDLDGTPFFRVSIGLEDPDDLIADLAQALAGEA